MRLFGLIIIGENTASSKIIILNEDFNLYGYNDQQGEQLVGSLRGLAKDYMKQVELGQRYCFWGDNFKCYSLISSTAKLGGFLFAQKDYVDDNAFYLLETALGYFEKNISYGWKVNSEDVDYELPDIQKIFKMYSYPYVESKNKKYSLPRPAGSTKASATDTKNFDGGNIQTGNQRWIAGDGEIIKEGAASKDSNCFCFKWFK